MRLLEPVLGKLEEVSEAFKEDLGALERIDGASLGLHRQLYPLDDDVLKNPERAISYAAELLSYAALAERERLPEDDPDRVALTHMAEPLAKLDTFTGTKDDVDRAAAIAVLLADEIDWDFEPDWLASAEAFEDYVETMRRREPARFLELQVDLVNRTNTASTQLYGEVKRRWRVWKTWARTRPEEALATGIGWVKYPDPRAQAVAKLIPPSAGGASLGMIAGGPPGGILGLIIGFIAGVLGHSFGPVEDDRHLAEPELDDPTR